MPSLSPSRRARLTRRHVARLNAAAATASDLPGIEAALASVEPPAWLSPSADVFLRMGVTIATVTRQES